MRAVKDAHRPRPKSMQEASAEKGAVHDARRARMDSDAYHSTVATSVRVERAAGGDVSDGLGTNDAGDGRVDLRGGRLPTRVDEPEQGVPLMRAEEAKLRALCVREGRGGRARQQADTSRAQGCRGEAVRQAAGRSVPELVEEGGKQNVLEVHHIQSPG